LKRNPEGRGGAEDCTASPRDWLDQGCDGDAPQQWASDGVGSHADEIRTHAGMGARAEGDLSGEAAGNVETVGIGESFGIAIGGEIRKMTRWPLRRFTF
jgi:hypothetical protein